MRCSAFTSTGRLLPLGLMATPSRFIIVTSQKLIGIKYSILLIQVWPHVLDWGRPFDVSGHPIQSICLILLPRWPRARNPPHRLHSQRRNVQKMSQCLKTPQPNPYSCSGDGFGGHARVAGNPFMLAPGTIAAPQP